MANYVWYTGRTIVTGRALATHLGFRRTRRRPSRANVIVCWGAQINDQRYPENRDFPRDAVYLNHPENIRRNRNKYESLRIMINDGVSCPIAHRPNDSINALRNREMSFPVIGRNFTHQGGRDARICLNLRDVQRARNAGSDFFVEYIPNRREFRIHVFRGEVIRRQEKKQTEETDNQWIKSLDNGWVFCEEPFTRPLPEGIDREAANAVRAMGLDFGAVDIVYSDFGRPYVLEVNTAPALNDGGVALYSRKIREYLNSRRNPARNNVLSQRLARRRRPLRFNILRR